MAGAEEALRTHLDVTFWQDMLQKSADEFFRRQFADLDFTGVGSLVAKSNLLVGYFHDTVVADGNPKDVRRQVLQGG